jgi:hypothetical protein
MSAINPKALIDKIKALPVERMAEVEDFVDFLRQRDQNRSLPHAATAASAPAFGRVWDNVYDGF